MATSGKKSRKSSKKALENIINQKSKKVDTSSGNTDETSFEAEESEQTCFKGQASEKSSSDEEKDEEPKASSRKNIGWSETECIYLVAGVKIFGVGKYL